MDKMETQAKRIADHMFMMSLNYTDVTKTGYEMSLAT